MGTNYYFLTKDKALVQEYFARKTDYGIEDKEYKLIDDPYFAYEIHICKFSSGWRSLFQGHHCYSSLKELDLFYQEHSGQLEIYDEYNRLITWAELKKTAIDRATWSPVPQKWVYELDDIFLFILLNAHPKTLISGFLLIMLSFKRRKLKPPNDFISIHLLI